MKPHIKVLICTLLFPVIASQSSAGMNVPVPPDRSQYLTLPDTRMLPPRHPAPAGANALRRVAYWTNVAWDSVAIDHTPPTTPVAAPAPEQLGPTRSSRALAIVHLAVYDALNAIARRYPGYTGPLAAYSDSSPDAAVARAAHDTLVALYPRQTGRLDALLSADLARLPDGRAKYNGADVGRRAAAAILALRANDGSQYPDPVVGVDYFPSLAPGQWRPDPVSRLPIALGAYWNRVRPFALSSAAQFRSPAPPALTSDAYTRAFDEVRRLGGNGVNTPTQRTADQTRIGIFWNYDSVAWIGTPVNVYNQLALQVALARTLDPLELARALALVNVALADAAIAVWDAKYAYDFWRPVTAIHEASPGTSPTGQGDGNPATHAVPGWTPLGAQATNLTGPDFTPPFPSYPSGHAGMGSAVFQVLRKLYGDNVSFTFLSDELNGISRDNSGAIRPRLPRSYGSLTQAEEENGVSRIYLGVHWRFDTTEGRRLGVRVGQQVVQRALVPPAN